MSGVELLRPLWLLALLPLAGFAWSLARRRGTAGDWGRVADPALMAAMRALGRVEAPGGGGAAWAALATAALVVLALSGPAVERRDAVSFRNLDGVILVLDASPSLTDGPDWTRLQALARFALSALGSRPAALVVFAGDAYVASDLTVDRRQLGQTLSLIGPGTVPDPGSRPERGLARARGMLEDGALLTGDVVLLTDGAGLGPETLTEAAAIAATGARLSVVTSGAGPEAESLARVGGGRTFGAGDAEGLVAYLTAEARTRLERQDWPMLFHVDLGRWLLGLAMIPAVLLLGRRVA